MKLILYYTTVIFFVAIKGISPLDTMLLFKKIDTEEIEFINTLPNSHSLEEQKVLLSATNSSYQTPLHYALSHGDIVAAFALIKIIHDDTLFLYSDSEENTPFSLAKNLPQTNLAQQMYRKMPHLVQRNLEI